MRKKTVEVPRTRHLLVGVTVGDDQVEVNRLMRAIAEAVDKALPTRTPTYMATVGALPRDLVRRPRSASTSTETPRSSRHVDRSRRPS